MQCIYIYTEYSFLIILKIMVLIDLSDAVWANFPDFQAPGPRNSRSARPYHPSVLFWAIFDISSPIS